MRVNFHWSYFLFVFIMIQYTCLSSAGGWHGLSSFMNVKRFIGSCYAHEQWYLSKLISHHSSNTCILILYTMHISSDFNMHSIIEKSFELSIESFFFSFLSFFIAYMEHLNETRSLWQAQNKWVTNTKMCMINTHLWYVASHRLAIWLLPVIKVVPDELKKSQTKCTQKKDGLKWCINLWKMIK